MLHLHTAQLAQRLVPQPSLSQPAHVGHLDGPTHMQLLQLRRRPCQQPSHLLLCRHVISQSQALGRHRPQVVSAARDV